jgi:hypothetical protein
VHRPIFGRIAAIIHNTNPSAALITSAEPDLSETVRLTIPGLLHEIMEDATTFQARQRRRRVNLDAALPVIAAVCLTLGIMLLGLSAASDPIGWITHVAVR